MLRRHFFRLAAACFILPALRWVPMPEWEEEPDVVEFGDVWFDKNSQCGTIEIYYDIPFPKRRHGIITFP